jgi:hypothetical protein
LQTFLEYLEPRRLFATTAELAVADQINRDRLDPQSAVDRNGLTLPAGIHANPAMTWNDALYADAMDWVTYEASQQDMGHVGPGNTVPLDRAKRYGDFVYAVEVGGILGPSYSTADPWWTQLALKLENEWIRHTDGHLWVITDPQVQLMGVAIIPGRYGNFDCLYGVADFATLRPSVADVNLDGIVNTADFTVMAQHFGQAASWTQGDVTGDGIVNAMDFNAIASDFGS